MKNFLLIVLLLSARFTHAQGDITAQVSAALKGGDAAALCSYMTASVELAINGQENTYSKADAQKLLAGFFRENPVQGFAIKHQGTSKLDDQYRIGELSTARGAYRVTFFMKKVQTGMQIKQLKIEKNE